MSQVAKVLPEGSTQPTAPNEFGPFTPSTNTGGIQEALQYAGEGGAVILSAGTYEVGQTIHLPTGSTLIGLSASATVIRLKMNPGTAVVPVISCDGESVCLSNFTVDGQGDKYVQNPLQTAYGAGIIVQGNRSKITGVNVRNCWDNGIMVNKYDQNNLSVAFYPENVIISGCQTENCGIGIHPDGTFKGGGIDIGAGTRVIVSHCIDYSSTVGFVVDFASSASCILSACISNKPRACPGDDFGTGCGFWIGAEALLLGCESYFAPNHAYVVDQYSQGTAVRAVACRAVNSGKEPWFPKNVNDADNPLFVHRP